MLPRLVVLYLDIICPGCFTNSGLSSVDSQGSLAPGGQQSLSYPCVHCCKRRESKCISPISLHPLDCVHLCQHTHLMVCVCMPPFHRQPQQLDIKIWIIQWEYVWKLQLSKYTLFLHVEIPTQAHFEEGHLTYANVSPGKIVKFIWS